MGGRAVDVGNFVQVGTYLHGRRQDRHFSRFDPGKIQNIVQESEQRVAAAPDHSDLLLLGVGQFGIGEQVGETEHAVERGADFVAHHGEEFALGQVCGLGGFLFADQLFFCRFAGSDVESGTAEPAELARGSADRDAIDADPNNLAITVQHPVLEIAEIPLLGCDREHFSADDFQIFGRDKRERVMADEFLERVAEDVHNTLREVGVVSPDVHLPDKLPGGIHNVAKPALGLPQRGDIENRADRDPPPAINLDVLTAVEQPAQASVPAKNPVFDIPFRSNGPGPCRDALHGVVGVDACEPGRAVGRDIFWSRPAEISEVPLPCQRFVQRIEPVDRLADRFDERAFCEGDGSQQIGINEVPPAVGINGKGNGQRDDRTDDHRRERGRAERGQGRLQPVGGGLDDHHSRSDTRG